MPEILVYLEMTGRPIWGIVLVWWQADAREEAMTIGVETSQKGTTGVKLSVNGCPFTHFNPFWNHGWNFLKRHFKKAFFVCRLDSNGCPQRGLHSTMYLKSAKIHLEQKLSKLFQISKLPRPSGSSRFPCCVFHNASTLHPVSNWQVDRQG